MANVLDLTTAVSTAIDGSSASLFNAVVNDLVGVEVESRKKLLITALAKRDDICKKIAGIKPQQQFFNADGTPAGEPLLTHQQNIERKKLTDQLRNLEAAVATALSDKPNFEPLKKAVGSDKAEEKTSEKQQSGA